MGGGKGLAVLHSIQIISTTATGNAGAMVLRMPGTGLTGSRNARETLLFSDPSSDSPKTNLEVKRSHELVRVAGIRIDPISKMRWEGKAGGVAR